MKRHLIVGRYGPGDRSRLPLGDGEVETRLDIVVGERSLDHGIGRALSDLIRLGAEDLGLAIAVPDGRITAPGQLDSHYAPSKPVRLNAAEAKDGEYLIGFGAIGGAETLSAGGDLTEAAANLFDALHRADASGARAIAVAPIPESGIGVAINDRLRRAAH